MTSRRLDAPPETRDTDPLVREIMTTGLVAITADSDLLIAARLLAARSVRHLPVMDGADCRGVLLEIDVIQALATANNPMVRPPLVAGALCRPVATVRPTQPRSAAARRMRDTGVDAVLVRAGESVVGILTATDLIRSLAADGPGPGPERSRR